AGGAAGASAGAGRLLSRNRRGGRSAAPRHDGICGQPISTLVIEKHREGLAEIVRQVAAGASLAAFDIELVTVSKDRVRVSVATSSALSSHNAAILAFRDVTEARAAQDELRKTKEILQRLIDSTVDALVAAAILGA